MLRRCVCVFLRASKSCRVTGNSSQAVCACVHVSMRWCVCAPSYVYEGQRVCVCVCVRAPDTRDFGKANI